MLENTGKYKDKRGSMNAMVPNFMDFSPCLWMPLFKLITL